MGQRKCICKQLKCCEYISWKLKGITCVSSHFFDGSKTSFLLRLHEDSKAVVFLTNCLASLTVSGKVRGDMVSKEPLLINIALQKTRPMLIWSECHSYHSAKIRRLALVDTTLQCDFLGNLNIWWGRPIHYLSLRDHLPLFFSGSSPTVLVFLSVSLLCRLLHTAGQRGLCAS